MTIWLVPPDPRVIEAMHQCHSNPVLQANPHSQHHYGEVTAAILSETQKIADYQRKSSTTHLQVAQLKPLISQLMAFTVPIQILANTL